MDELLNDKEILCTTAKEYLKLPELESTPKQIQKRTSRKKYFFNCKDHHILPQAWQDEVNSQCIECVKYEPMETLPNGKLPTGHELLQYLLTVKMQNTGCHENSEKKGCT